MSDPVIITEPGDAMRALWAVRVIRKLSQRELAVSGTWQSELSSWERGTMVPTLGSLLKVAAALGYDLALVPREDAA
jgi:transcriptional regulator with XRE-family HTH domain